MQPYFMPYIGYFQLMQAVDEFVVYDNIQFTKRGWIQRNRILMNGTDYMFSLPVKKNSDYLDICERQLADSFAVERKKILRRIESAYRKAPIFTSVISVIEQCFNYEDRNLFKFIYNSLLLVCEYLGIASKIVISSELARNNELKNQDKVIDICELMKAKSYINTIGGQALYSKEKFLEKGIELKFIKSKPITYKQFDNEFIPWLSIIDVMMFNSKEQIKEMLKEYEII